MSRIKEWKNKARIKYHEHLAQKKADKEYSKEIEDKYYQKEKRKVLKKEAIARARRRAHGGLGAEIFGSKPKQHHKKGKKQQPQRNLFDELGDMF